MLPADRKEGPRYRASRCQIGKGTTNYSGKPWVLHNSRASSLEGRGILRHQGAKIKVQYFAKLEGDAKSPERIGEILQGIAYLIDTEALPTDFTRFGGE